MAGEQPLMGTGGLATARRVVAYRGEDDYWVAECPSLPGCISQGATSSEAVSNLKEAVHAYIDALEADGLPVPEESVGREDDPR